MNINIVSCTLQSHITTCTVSYCTVVLIILILYSTVHCSTVPVEVGKWELYYTLMHTVTMLYSKDHITDNNLH